MESNVTRRQKEVLTEMIELYKSYKYLWDSNQALYFNKDARNQGFASLLEVYKKMKPEATLNDVKKKVENMRSTYKRELKKVKGRFVTGSASNEEEPYVPSLWYYDLMLFLDEKDMVLPGAETMEEEEEDECDHKDQQFMNGTQDYATDDPPVENPVKLRPTCEPSDPLSKNIFPSNAPIIPKRAKLSLRKKEEALMDAAQALLRGPGNQCDTFGTNVGQQLQMLKPDQQAIAQKLISDVLFLGKFGQLAPTATVSPTAPGSLPLPVSDPPPGVTYHLSNSQPYECFNHQQDRFSRSSHLSSPPSSSRTTPSPSSGVNHSGSQRPHAQINSEGLNIANNGRQLGDAVDHGG